MAQNGLVDRGLYFSKGSPHQLSRVAILWESIHVNAPCLLRTAAPLVSIAGPPVLRMGASEEVCEVNLSYVFSITAL